MIALMAPAVLMAVKPGHTDEESTPKACAAPVSATSEGKKARFKAEPRKVVGRAPIFVRTNFFLDQPHDERNEIVQGTETDTDATHACVHLEAGEAGKAQIEKLGQCKKLEALWVARNLAEHGVPLPGNPDTLKTLQLGEGVATLLAIRAHPAAGPTLGGDTFRNVSAFTSLTSLVLEGLYFGTQTHPFGALASVTTLKQFRFSSNLPLSDDATPQQTFDAFIYFLQANPNLELLSVFGTYEPALEQDTPSHHKLAEALSVIQRLRYLGLGHMVLNATDLTELPMQHLEHLCLTAVEGVSTLEPLTQAPVLRCFHADNLDNLTAEGLGHLAHIRHLRQLFLADIPNSDDVARTLCTLGDKTPETLFVWPLVFFSEDACQRLTQVFGENCGPINAARAIPGPLRAEHVCPVSYSRARNDDVDRSHIPYYTED